MTSFKSWDEWHLACRKTLEDKGINGRLHGIGEDGIFFIFDRDKHDTLWTFDRYGALKRYVQANPAQVDSAETTTLNISDTLSELDVHVNYLPVRDSEKKLIWQQMAEGAEDGIIKPDGPSQFSWRIGNDSNHRYKLR